MARNRFAPNKGLVKKVGNMPTSSTLGRVYEDGAIVVHQGESGDCMYVVQEGQVEVIVEQAGLATRLAVRSAGDFFGEMAIFEREVRMATVRALGRTRILKVDKKNLLRSIHDDPSLALHTVETLSGRVRELSQAVAKLRASCPSPADQPIRKPRDDGAR